MSLLKYSEIKKMDKKTRETKLKELKVELSKANVVANKTNSKTKEIKKAISRVLTITNAEKAEVKK